MAFEPDIIVTSPESSEIVLVVEARTFVRSLADSERQLKKYMAAVGSPVGLLVTPERLRLYRDQYLPSSEDSITTAAEFDVTKVLPFHPTGDRRVDALAFERDVQSWLEGLSTESSLRELPPELRRAVELYIVPAVSWGAVRSGHPRFEVSA